MKNDFTEVKKHTHQVSIRKQHGRLHLRNILKCVASEDIQLKRDLWASRIRCDGAR